MITFKLLSPDSQHYQTVVDLRETILRKPLGLRFSEKDLEKDKAHIHVAGFLGEEVVATALLIPEGKSLRMKRVAVREDLQNQGIATEMMKFCEDYGREQGFSDVYCHARHTAVQFYLKNKYIPEGEDFDETGIPHLKMRKKLKKES
jgi:predicted GNAT family N-acyltransferase